MAESLLAHRARDRTDHAIDARAGGRAMMPSFMSSITPALVRTRVYLVLTLHTCRLTTGLLTDGLVYPVALELVLDDEACFDQSAVNGSSGGVRLAPTSP